MARFTQLHEWNLSPREAIAMQQELRRRVVIAPPGKPIESIETVAGADISFNKYSPMLYAGIVVLRLPSQSGQPLQIIEEVGAVSETKFPYVPGLLSFREAAALLVA